MNDDGFMPSDDDEIQVRLAALSGAYVVLARHLAVRGVVDLDLLSEELGTMADSQAAPIWQEQNRRLADVLRTVDSQLERRR